MNMQFNGAKFQLLRYGNNDNLKLKTYYRSPDDSVIPESPKVRDLGVIMANNGDFSDHITKTVQSASNMSGWIFRTFYARDEYTMKTLFKSLVLSRLEYCSPLIHPSTAALTMKLETVQRAFTRKIEGMKDKNYWVRLQQLKMYSVERRRERFIILYMFKILHGLVPNIGIDFKTNDRTGTRAIVPVLNTLTPSLIKRLKYDLLSFKGPRIFNILPYEIRSYKPSKLSNDIILGFKNVLDRFLQTVPDQPTIYGLNRPANSNSIIDQIPYSKK